MQSRELSDIDPLDATLHKKLEDIEVGGRCANWFAAYPLGDKETLFRRDTVEFLKELCSQIQKRFPLSKNSVMAQLRALDVDVALSTQNRPKSIINLARHFPSLVNEKELDNLQDQWHNLPQAKESIVHLTKLSSPSF